MVREEEHLRRPTPLGSYLFLPLVAHVFFQRRSCFLAVTSRLGSPGAILAWEPALEWQVIILAALVRDLKIISCLAYR